MTVKFLLFYYLISSGIRFCRVTPSTSSTFCVCLSVCSEECHCCSSLKGFLFFFFLQPTGLRPAQRARRDFITNLVALRKKRGPSKEGGQYPIENRQREREIRQTIEADGPIELVSSPKTKWSLTARARPTPYWTSNVIAAAQKPIWQGLKSRGGQKKWRELEGWREGRSRGSPRSR